MNHPPSPTTSLSTTSASTTSASTTSLSPTRIVLAVLAVSALIVGTACSSSADSGDDAASSSTESTSPPPPTAPSTAIAGVPPGPTAGALLVSAFFLHDGWIAKGAAQQVESVDGLNAALDALLAGPTGADVDAGLTTAVPANADVRSLSIDDGGVAVVDFTRPFETRDTQPQVAQVVFTLTQVEGISSVQFLIDGEPNGATGVRPLTRADFARYTPPALVETPTPGQTVASPLAVSGTASTAGTTVTYRLEDLFGGLIAEGAFVRGDDGTGAGPFAGSIDAGTFTGSAVLIVPAPDPAIDDASLNRVPISLS